MTASLVIGSDALGRYLISGSGEDGSVVLRLLGAAFPIFARENFYHCFSDLSFF